MASQPVADMARERATSHALCDVRALGVYLRGGAARQQRFEAVRQTMEADRVFRVADYHHASREERYVALCFSSGKAKQRRDGVDFAFMLRKRWLRSHDATPQGLQ